ncbi:MAG: phage portal protein [Planctomycetes bacterium]|nr:phage portal protein [Planctomycetota bacterium]
MKRRASVSKMRAKSAPAIARAKHGTVSASTARISIRQKASPRSFHASSQPKNAAPARSRRGIIKARFDSAANTPENRKHWANSDSLSVNAALSTGVRSTLRSRARYEVENNSYAKGMVLTLANDTIGAGPRLQLRTPDAGVNSAVEDAFSEWAAAVRLGEKLRTMRMARASSGECFAVLARNDNLKSPVKFDIRLVEADQCAEPTGNFASDPSAVDGIKYDKFGNPTKYFILSAHPGSGSSFSQDGDWFDASKVLHYYRSDRPGQGRGIPDITPALPLFAMLRRYTLAVLAAAETAANFAGTVESDVPPDGAADDIGAMDTVELERNMLLTLPAGWKMGQVKAEQPTTTYGEFKKEVLNEIARCLNMPFNISAGNSSGYNYASGRLDQQTYYKCVRVEQHHIGDTLLNPVFDAWFDEAILVTDLLPRRARLLKRKPREWFWPGFEHVDPAKEATAQQTRLQSNTTTLASEYARQGKDWEAEVEQRAIEVKRLAKLGLSPLPLPGTNQPSVDPADVAEQLSEDN